MRINSVYYLRYVIAISLIKYIVLCNTNLEYGIISMKVLICSQFDRAMSLLSNFVDTVLFSVFWVVFGYFGVLIGRRGLIHRFIGIVFLYCSKQYFPWN